MKGPKPRFGLALIYCGGAMRCTRSLSAAWNGATSDEAGPAVSIWRCRSSARAWLRAATAAGGLDGQPRLASGTREADTPLQMSRTRSDDGFDRVSQLSMSNKTLSRFSVSATSLPCCGCQS